MFAEKERLVIEDRFSVARHGGIQKRDVMANVGGRRSALLCLYSRSTTLMISVKRLCAICGVRFA